MRVKISSVLTGFFGLALVVSFAIFISLVIYTLRYTTDTLLQARFQRLLALNEKVAREFVERNRLLTRALGEDFMIVKSYVDLKTGFAGSDLEVLEKAFKPKGKKDRSKILMGEGVEMYEFMHEAHHKEIGKYLATTFFHDLLLITKDETIIYSFRKGDEFGQSITAAAKTSAKIRMLKEQLKGLSQKDRVHGGAYISTDGGSGVLTVTPINIEGKVAGYVATMTPLAYLNTLLDDAGMMGKTGSLFVSDDKGTTLVWKRSDSKNKTKPDLGQGFLEFSLEKSGKAKRFGFEENSAYVGARPLQLGGRQFHLFLSQNTDEIFSATSRLQFNLIIAGSVILCLVLGVTLIGLRRVSQPLGLVTSELQKLSENGNMDIRPIKSSLFEIQRISDALIVFRDSITEKSRLEVSAVEDKRKEAGKQVELESLLRQFREIMDSSLASITNKSAEMRTSADELISVAGLTTREAQNASNSSKNATDNVQAVAGAATDLSTSIQDVAKQIKTTSQTISAANDAAESTNDSVAELTNATNEIGNVLDIIRSISQKINLLALNATIEAVHAGEYGKSFSIVANEVKQLSEETSVAISQIEKQIKNVKSSADYAVGLVKIISHSIIDVAKASKLISEAVVEQAQSATEISGQATTVAEESLVVTGAVDEVASSIKQTSDVANQVMEVSDEFTKLAKRLSDLSGTMLEDMEQDLEERKRDLKDRMVNETAREVKGEVSLF